MRLCGVALLGFLLSTVTAAPAGEDLAPNAEDIALRYVLVPREGITPSWKKLSNVAQELEETFDNAKLTVMRGDVEDVPLQGRLRAPESELDYYESLLTRDGRLPANTKFLKEKPNARGEVNRVVSLILDAMVYPFTDNIACQIRSIGINYINLACSASESGVYGVLQYRLLYLYLLGLAFSLVSSSTSDNT